MHFTSLLATICIIMLLNDAPASARGDLDSSLSFSDVERPQYSDGAPQWTLAVDRFHAIHLQPFISAADHGCGDDVQTGEAWPIGCRFVAWQRQLMLWRSLPAREQLLRVDGAVNALPYVADRENWGEADRWETPAEMFDRGGDCEGFAIAKYHALIALGFDKNALKIAVVWDAQDREEHAVLFVRTAGETWLLDNKLLAPQPAADFASRYHLVYAVSPEGARIPVSRPAAVAAAFSGARLSRNGRMLVWNVQPKKRAQPAATMALRPMVAKTIGAPHDVADLAPRQRDVGRSSPILAASAGAGLLGPAWRAGRAAEDPVAHLPDPIGSVAVQLMIWAKDEGGEGEMATIRQPGFFPSTANVLADTGTLPLRSFATG